jgi:hypothetical protein
VKKIEPYRWIILAHHIPPSPVILHGSSVWRLSAIGLKNALYVLSDMRDPRSYTVRDEDGGSILILFFPGITDDQIKSSTARTLARVRRSTGFLANSIAKSSESFTMLEFK